jgi:tRNA nucleotidyltransferase/poly(A) polymerase
MFAIPDYINTILTSLAARGHDAHIVGGCVRDFIIGTAPHDFDLATDALPSQVKDVFREFRIVETGIAHGTVTVIIENQPVEITTYRIDAEYTDNRRPESVTFTASLFEDTARRDFTMNALAYNSAVGVVDYHGGLGDIERKIIRCVGDARERFREDSLRIMRAVRFSSQLGFAIEDETLSAMRECAHLISNISAERIEAELRKLVCGADVRRVICDYADILSAAVPEIAPMIAFDQRNPHHVHDVLTHSAIATENVAPAAHMRYAALLHDIGKPPTFAADDNGVGHFYGHSKAGEEIADIIMARLKCDNQTREKVKTLIRYHDAPPDNDRKAIKRKLNKLGAETFFDLLNLQRADNKAQNPNLLHRRSYFDEIESTAREILAENECFSLKDLQINGNDLIELNYRGKQIGEILNAALLAVIDEKVTNNRETLLNHITKLYPPQ